MKTLILCRHAKSDWPPGVADERRPLKERGINDAKYLAGLLAKQDFMPDLILSSTANRAYSTAELFSETLGYKDEIIKKPELYLASVNTLIDTVRNVSNDNEVVMVFGHNPTMESAVEWLLQSDTSFEMPTCGMACFETFEPNWSRFGQYKAKMRWYLIPRLMRKGY